MALRNLAASLKSGVYRPVDTEVTNMNALNVFEAHWCIVAQVVQVWVSVSAQQFAPGPSKFRLSLPEGLEANFTGSAGLIGVAASESSLGGRVSANSSEDLAEVSIDLNDTVLVIVHIGFSYRIPPP